MEDTLIVKLILLGGALAAALIAMKKLYVSIRGWVAHWIAAREEEHNTIRSIFRELSSNGGSTLRDKIDRMDYMLTLQNSKQRALLQDVQEGVVETDSEGRVVWANRTYLKRVGASLQDVQGDGWLSLLQPEHRQRVLENWTLAVDRAVDLEHEIVLASAEGPVPILAKSHALRDLEGNLLGHLTVISFRE